MSVADALEEYQRRGWVLLALPPDVAAAVENLPATQQTALVLSARIAQLTDAARARGVAGRPVLQDWVMELPWIQQTALITAMRGPDVPGIVALDRWVRWLRGQVLRAAIPGHPFMSTTPVGELRDRIDLLAGALESQSGHFTVHFMEALKVLAYTKDGPDGALAHRALALVCARLRVVPEPVHVWQERTGVMPS